MKLTARQMQSLEFLNENSGGKIAAPYCGTRTLAALERRGLVLNDGNSWFGIWTITEAGRAALAKERDKSE